MLALPVCAQSSKSGSQNITVYDSNNHAIGTRVNPEANVPLEQNKTVLSAPGESGQNSEKKDIPFWQQVLNMILSLAIVLIVAYIVMNLMKKIYNGDIKFPGNTKLSESSGKRGLIRVVETASLGQGRTLYLITVESRAFLIASSGQQFTLIGEFQDEDWQKSVPSGTPVNGPIETALGKILNKMEKQN